MQFNSITESVIHVSWSYIATAIATVCFSTFCYFYKNRNLPPGPIGLPYFGFWPFISENNCYSQLKTLQKKYGDLYSFTSTGKLYISLGSFSVLHEAHIKKSDCFVGRFEDYNLLTAIFADGVGFMNGDGWKVLKKFFMQSFKERGLLTVNDAILNSVFESVNLVVKELHSQAGRPVDILPIFIDQCTHVLKRALFGDHIVSKELIVKINEHFGSVMECMTATNLLLTGNAAKYFILPFTPGYQDFKKSHSSIQSLIYKLIDDHKSTYDEAFDRDIIDEYLREQRKRKSKEDPSSQYFTDKALMSTLIQIIGDGVLSVATLATLFLKILLDHPEEQEKIYQELVEVIGVKKWPTVVDNNRLPYTNAFMMEAMRTSVFFPFFPSLQCNRETTIRGYRIPVGAITLINTWSTHNDPKVYEEPEKFDPTRFLNQNHSPKSNLPITFGVGKRACVAENFTMSQVFMILATIICDYHVTIVDDSHKKNEPSFSGKLHIMAKPRNKNL